MVTELVNKRFSTLRLCKGLHIVDEISLSLTKIYSHSCHSHNSNIKYRQWDTRYAACCLVWCSGWAPEWILWGVPTSATDSRVAINSIFFLPVLSLLRGGTYAFHSHTHSWRKGQPSWIFSSKRKPRNVSTHQQSGDPRLGHHQRQHRGHNAAGTRHNFSTKHSWNINHGSCT